MCFLALCSVPMPGRCAPRLAAIFGENMVLQQGVPVPVWGWAQPGEVVTVAIGGQTAKGDADQKGRWQVRLSPMRSQDVPLELAVVGAMGAAIRVKNVLVGEVWLCTGPSNIFWPVKRCDKAEEEMASAHFPKLRFFTVARKTADEPQADCEGRWVECSSASVADASGLGFFFARRLHRELRVPVGLVQSFWGGSRIEAWTSLEALRSRPALKHILDYWAREGEAFASGQAEGAYRRERAEWWAAAAEPKSPGRKGAKKPKPPADPRTSPHRPGCLFNAMIAPLAPFPIRGAITYQGLGNLFWPEYSRELLETMIADWRARWNLGDFPFGMVQPAPYTCEGWAQSGPHAYSIQRESQVQVLQTVPNTGLALTMDIDAVKSLHFPQKQPVAGRLAAWALATVYGRPTPWRGPVCGSLAVEGSRLRLHFEHAEGGLRTRDGKAPTCFTVAGVDRVFHPAAAIIQGSDVLVSSDRVPLPTAVRFAWADTDVPNLINRDGLPAALFEKK